MMKHYEYDYLTRQDMPEDEAKNLQDKLVGLITAQNGTITDLPKAYKKRLAYRVKKQDAAYVNTILFQAEPAFAVEFKKETDTIAEILRGLILYYDPEKLKKEPRRERSLINRKPAENETTVAIKILAIVEKPIKKEIVVQSEEPTKEEKIEKKSEQKATEEKTAKPRRKTKAKTELRDIGEKLDEILK